MRTLIVGATLAAASLSTAISSAQTDPSAEDVFARAFAAKPAEFLNRLHELQALQRQDAQASCVEAYLFSALRRLTPGQWRDCLGVAKAIASAPPYLKQVCASQSDAAKCQSALEPPGYRTTDIVLTPNVNTVALQQDAEGSTELVPIFDRKLETQDHILVNAPSTECELAIHTSSVSITVNRCTDLHLTHEKDADVLQLALVLPPEPTPAASIPTTKAAETAQQGNDVSSHSGQGAPKEPKAEQHSQTWLISSYVTGGLAVASLVTSAAFALHANSKYSDSEKAGHCTSSGCDDTGYGLRTEAFSSAHAATGFFVAGAVLAGASVTLFVIDRKQRAHIESSFNGTTFSVGVRGEL